MNNSKLKQMACVAILCAGGTSAFAGDGSLFEKNANTYDTKAVDDMVAAVEYIQEAGKDGVLDTKEKTEFGKMQEEHGGKPIVFVPSGGQGEDEVMPEGQAMANYLRSIGIPEERILIEDKSVNTYENINLSMKLIRANREGQTDPSLVEGRPSKEDPFKVAFSTTNYHVFRAGLLASGMGLNMEGIGSKTKRYFWINAFVREYIATLYAERKVHIRVILTLLLLMLLGSGVLYAAAILW